ncbi:MAG: hypothetical protein COB56_07950 [Robiginitomaculum sp.]|nr:MAG: hypothetical protein COB56_07950 [Robiginitomaculum sp.]
MKVSLTTSSVEKAKPKAKPYEIRDKNLIGFILRIQPTGKKTFYCEYRRGSRVKIGPYPSVTVLFARTRAKDILMDFYQGLDPKYVLRNTPIIKSYNEYLKLHYFPWVDANHKNPEDTKRLLQVECGEFSQYKLSDITPHAVEKWRLSKIAKGNSPHTANKCFAYLRASLSKAEEWELCKENPISRMKRIKTNQSIRIRYLSVEEEKRLRSALAKRECDRKKRFKINTHFSDHLKPMFLLAINTGMRRAEQFSLAWNQVDLHLNQITVTAENSKSRKVRYIPLNQEARHTLTTWLAQQQGHPQLVFQKHDETPFKDVKTAWKNLLKKAEITDFRWHDLRHHFASRLAIAGADLNTIRELLGHSSYEMTLKYAHLSEGHKAKAVALLDSVTYRH